MKINSLKSYQSGLEFQGQKEKLIEKILTTPNTKKVKLLASDVERICESMGFLRNKKRGSHMSFKISETENISFVTPHSNKNELSATDKVKFKEFLQRFYKKDTTPTDKVENQLNLTV